MSEDDVVECGHPTCEANTMRGTADAEGWLTSPYNRDLHRCPDHVRDWS